MDEQKHNTSRDTSSGQESGLSSLSSASHAGNWPQAAVSIVVALVVGALMFLQKKDGTPVLAPEWGLPSLVAIAIPTHAGKVWAKVKGLRAR